MTFGPKFRLSFLSAAIFAAIGVYMPFFPVWLESRRLDPATIGWILAAAIVVRVVVTAPLLALTERGLDPRALLALSQGALMILFLLLLGAEGAVAIGAVVVVIAVAQSPLVPTSDLLATEAARADPRLSYGVIRSWGSLAFLASTLAGGLLLSRAPIDAVLIVMAALAAVGAIAAVAAPAARSEAAQPERTGAPTPRALVWLIAAGAAIHASHAALYAFGSIAWRAQGFSESTIGAFWAVGVVAEILLFWVVGRRFFAEPRPVALLLVGAAGAALRFAAMAFAPGLGATLFLQLLHGLSFGATHLGMMAALGAFAPPGGRGRAQGILAASMAFALAIATIASGSIYPVAGPLVFLAMAPVALAGAAFALRARRLLADRW